MVTRLEKKAAKKAKRAGESKALLMTSRNLSQKVVSN